MPEVFGGHHAGGVIRMLCFVFAALIVLLDQFIKRWILLTLALYESMDLIPGIIGLTYVRNTGAAFSILSDQRWLLIGIAIACSILLIAILLRYNEGFWGTIGLASVLGGTIGNLVDRISYGYVVDIFDLQFVNFAIFNIADIFITLGGVTFLIYFIIMTVKPEKIKEGIYGEAEHPQYERIVIEEEIGMYDFEYGEETEIPVEGGNEAAKITISASDQPEGIPVIHSKSEPNIPADNLPADVTSALDALSELEQELEEAGALEDYDLDELLKKYGFEDDDTSQQ